MFKFKHKLGIAGILIFVGILVHFLPASVITFITNVLAISFGAIVIALLYWWIGSQITGSYEFIINPKWKAKKEAEIQEEIERMMGT